MENDIRLKIIGRRNPIPDFVQQEIGRNSKNDGGQQRDRALPGSELRKPR